MANKLSPASEMCIDEGLEGGLNELSELVEKPVRTMHNWYNSHPRLFRAVVLGAVELRKEDRRQKRAQANG